MTRTTVKNQGQETVEHGRPTAGGASTSNLPGSIRSALTSGLAAGLGGGLVLFSGLRALRRGQWGRAAVRLAVGGLLLAVGVRQRRSGSEETGSGGHVDQEDVAGTAPDVEDASIDSAGTSGSGPDEAREVDFETGVDEPDEGVGSGTFDARRGVPVPEPALEAGVLDLDGPVYWAVRDRDDAVFVSHRRSLFEESDGVEYVTSSEIDDDQVLSVPDVVLDHWEDVDDVEPVGDDDELVFATSEDLRWVDVLWVVSEHRTDEFDDL